MFPKDWVRRPLGDIARISSGGTPDRSESTYWGGDIPWVTTGEIQFNTIRDTREKITANGIKNSAAKLYPPGTLLMAMYGQGKTRGQVAKLDIEAATNQACAAIQLHEFHDAEFYFQFLSSQYDALRELGNAGTQKNLNGGIIKDFEVPVPPHPEQQRIAKVLAKWDQAIATAERLLATELQQKQALMQGLLTEAALAESLQGTWTSYRLGDLFTERVEAGQTHLPLLSITREDGVVYRTEVGRKDTSNEDKSKYLRINRGDIGYNTMRMWQGVSALSSLEGIVSPAYTVVIPGDRIDGRFAAYLFKLNRVVAMFCRHSQGLVSDTWNLKFSHFAKIRVSIPDIESQRKIVSILESSDALIQAQGREIAKLRQEKSALMSGLLSGQRRLPLSSSVLAEAAA